LWPKQIAAKLPNAFKKSIHHNFKMSASVSGSHGPSLLSSKMVFGSRQRKLCHWPAGTFMATTSPLGDNSIDSEQMRYNSS
jgi:hypothetical protein